jgi:hypothetical protein
MKFAATSSRVPVLYFFQYVRRSEKKSDALRYIPDNSAFSYNPIRFMLYVAYFWYFRVALEKDECTAYSDLPHCVHTRLSGINSSLDMCSYSRSTC